jgi:hypothetical protein
LGQEAADFVNAGVHHFKPRSVMDG